MTTFDPSSRITPNQFLPPANPADDATASHANATAVPPPPTGSFNPEPSFHPQISAPVTTAALSQGAAAAPFDVRGQQSRPVDLDLMKLSQAAYNPGVTQAGNWSRVSDSDLRSAGIDPATMNTGSSGFRAGVYSDGNGHNALAFAGSNDIQDWAGANIPQGLGLDAKQYDQAVSLAQSVASSQYGANGSLAITGHSLGGGLAATASLATGVPAVTYDAAGVHDNTMERLGLDPGAAKAEAESGLIRRYHVAGEPLTALQETTPIVSALLPDAPGHSITVANPHPGAGLLQLHSQQTMVDALEQSHPWG